jgi:hypothetical protein
MITELAVWFGAGVLSTGIMCYKLKPVNRQDIPLLGIMFLGGILSLVALGLAYIEDRWDNPR